MPDKEYCVYRHTSPSGKVYIGITCQNPIRRWAHGHGYRNNPYFSRAILKYGWDNFTHEVLFSGLSKEDACEKEIELIRFHKSNNEDYGYNISSGGEFPTTGRKLSDEEKRKLSECRRGEKHPFYGKKLSEEHRRKMSDAHKGKTVWDEAHRRQISERQKGDKNHMYGKHLSDETRRKMSDSHRKYTIVQMDMSGELVAVFPTTKAAAKAVGGHASTIAAVCAGKRKTSAGFKWKYEMF
jgi:group I intron endonuclease